MHVLVYVLMQSPKDLLLPLQAKKKKKKKKKKKTVFVLISAVHEIRLFHLREKKKVNIGLIKKKLAKRSLIISVLIKAQDRSSSMPTLNGVIHIGIFLYCLNTDIK